MAQELIQVNVRNPLIKILLILLLIVAGTWSYFAVRWYLGNTLAEYSSPEAGGFDAAGMAVAMGPNDPFTHWRVAQVSQKNLPLDQQAQAVAEYEKAVSLSPNDYRYWTSLGTAYEQAGEAGKAENALRRAVALAPAYAFPHWYLGNLLLRNARYDEAFAELRLASKADADFQPQQFNLVWQVYGDDPAALKNAVGETAEARAAFALYLLSQKRYDEGLRLWGDLSHEQQTATQNTAQAMIKALLADLRFHNALKVWNDIATDKYHTEVGRIFDGSFEEPVSYGPETVFGWQVQGDPQMQVGIDPDRSHSGSRSLKMVFQARSNLQAVIIYQLIPVQPNTTYDVEYFLTTDKLVTGSSPQVDILDPASQGVIVSSPTAPGGTNKWMPVTFSFKTQENREAVVLRVARVSCATKETPVCPIFGSIWYDDFSIKRRN